jgi:hypothetical protein
MTANPPLFFGFPGNSIFSSGLIDAVQTNETPESDSLALAAIGVGLSIALLFQSWARISRVTRLAFDLVEEPDGGFIASTMLDIR